MDRAVTAHVRITVIGYDGAPLSPPARTALDEATLVVGGARHLEAVGLLTSDQGSGEDAPTPGGLDDPGGASASHARTTIKLGPLAPAIDALSRHAGQAVVLASGDPGFFGVLRVLHEAGLEPVRVLPAVSSIAAAFARAGIPWDDALVVSAHGSGDGRELRRAANVCRVRPKVALLTGPGAGAVQLARELLGGREDVAPQRVLVVAQRLGLGESDKDNRPTEADSNHVDHEHRQHEQGQQQQQKRGQQQHGQQGQQQERVEVLTLDQAAERAEFLEPNVVLCLDPGLLGERANDAHGNRRPSRKRWMAGWTGAASASGTTDAPGTAGGTGVWALGESAFEHRDGQITKAEVRAQILARLGPSLGDLIWDLGAGSGAVGIECARFGAAVIAVEQDASSCERINANAASHGVEVAVVRGRAPGVLAELPRPDAVFVGGGGVDVVRGALEHGPARIVVALTGVERVGEVVQSLEADGREVGGVLAQFSRMAALPNGTHRFAALNPVYLVWGSGA